MALGTLHERVGEQEHLGLQSDVGSRFLGGMWGRLLGQDATETAASAQLGNMRSNNRSGGIQFGLDLYRGASSTGARTLVGAYGGHLWGETATFLELSEQPLHLAGGTHSQGWFAGLYATHYAASGWYADAVVQGDWLDHRANAIDGTVLETKSRQWLASIEAGRRFAVGRGFKLEPQVQLIYGNARVDGASDSLGIRNDFAIENSVTGRLGLRLKRTWEYDQNSDGGLFTAYLKANLWAVFDGGGTILTVAGSDPGRVTYRTRWADAGVGTTFSLSANAELFADVDVEVGLDRGGTALNGHTGLRIKF